MDTIPEIKNLLEKEDTILLLINKNRSDSDYIASVFSLLYTLKKIGKIVKFYPIEAMSKFTALPFFEEINKMKSFVLEISDQASSISDIYYKKGQKDIKFIFTTINGEIGAQNISIRPLDQESEPEIIISAGIQSLDDLGNFYEKNFKLFFEKPILNIDNFSSNRDYGKINLVEAEKSFSSLITTVIRSLNEEIFDKTITTNLFWGIINFYKQKTIDNITVQTMIYLRERGAEIKRVVDFILPKSNAHQKSLIVNAFEGMKTLKNLDLPVLYLKRSFLSEANIQEKEILFLINNIRGQMLFLPDFILIWNSFTSNKFSKIIFYSSDQIKIEEIAHFFKVKSGKNSVLFVIENNNLDYVEKMIYNLLIAYKK